MEIRIVSSLLLVAVLQNEFLLTRSDKILSLSFFSAQSHKNVYEPLLIELANRGHIITVVTPIKSSNSHRNITQIVGMSHEELPGLRDVNMFERRSKKEDVNPLTMVDMFADLCRSYYNMSEMQSLLKEKFDLIFLSTFMNECTFGLVHHFKAPFIFISPVSPIQWQAAITGTPSPASFVPVLMFGYNDHMNFFQRVKNLLGQLIFQTIFEFYYMPKMEKVYKEYLGDDTPSLTEIQKNVSLILANSHLTLSYARPLMPDIVEVGGMACRPAKPLPKDLDNFITGAGKEGVIFFSMGSVIKANMMPESVRKMFVNAFSKLKQRVVWKWETEKMEDLPKNVKLGKWLPQQDILGHPNVKMFITHGGLGSTVEAVYHGVPLLSIPMFGDQDSNSKQSSRLGFAYTLEYRDLSEESIIAAINTILNEPSYNQRAKELSEIYRDRPQNPLETAVYWTEYVLRHKGAKHLRSPARDLSWAQYHSYDVVAFVLGITSLVLYLIYITLRFVVRKLCGLGKNSSSSSVKKRN